jgi:ATP-dependent Zn protease
VNHRLLLEVAFHEAGHSVIARVLGLRSGRATLCDHDGVARAYFADDGSVDNVLAVLAGRAATEVILGYASDYGCSIDDDQALALLKAHGREPWYAKIVQRQCLDDARALIRRHRGAVERVADALLAKETLTAREIDALTH